MKQNSYILAAAALLLSAQAAASTCGTSKLCVPGDFSSANGADFNMNLLGGNVYLDFSSGGAVLDIETTLYNLQPITFHASPFANPTATSAGTSTLTYSAISHYSLGTFPVYGFDAEFYLEGTGFGELVDIDGTRGNWSLNVPLRATWNGTSFDFGSVLFSTAASYSYYSAYKTLSTISGQDMDYATGDAFLVAQATVIGGPFSGLRITLGLNGNDPVVSSVPEPSVASQLLAALALLGAAVRVRGRSHIPTA
jgi:hypothetical protein